MDQDFLKKSKTIAYDIAEGCLAGNLEVSDAVNDFLRFHPRQAAIYPAAQLRDEAYDIMTEFTLDD